MLERDGLVKQSGNRGVVVATSLPRKPMSFISFMAI